MLLIDAAAKVVFDWRRRNFLLLVFAAMLVKTGIWHIPNINETIAFARNPFGDLEDVLLLPDLGPERSLELQIGRASCRERV